MASEIYLLSFPSTHVLHKCHEPVFCHLSCFFTQLSFPLLT
jgi:hypothetical protein